jgi:CubicO group peptidase (beta-lactamase class C family)
MPPTVKSLVFVLTFLIMAGCGREQSNIPSEITFGKTGAQMDQFLTRLNNFGFSGSVLVARDDTILLHQAYGVADVRSDIKNHTSTLFSTGSVTKQFTAAAILKLEMDGRLKTSDSITRFFSDVPDDKVGITLHQLLTHSSGLADNYGPDEERLDREQFLRRVFSCSLSYPPGDHYEYSNAGYSLLAAVVEVVTGKEYEAYLRDTFFNPLGMLHTGLKLLDVPDSLVARSQNKDMSYPSPLDRPDEYYNLKGNGGILSTPADMYRWYLALHKGEILNETARRKLFTPYIKEYPDGDSFYGYGWVVQEYGPGDTLIWHNGGAMPHGWSCADYFYVQDNIVCIVFSNATIDGSLPVDDVAENLARMAMGREITMPPETADVSPADMDRWAGDYRAGKGQITVFVENGIMRLSPMGQALTDVLFPSPYADRLPKYNDMTEKAVSLMSKGKFQEAAANFDEAPGENMWKSMIREWWQAFDSLGAFEGIKIQGTVAAGGAQTYCRLLFKNDQPFCRFFWMAGKCGGMTTTGPLTKDFLSQSENRFAGFSLRDGTLTTATFKEDGTLVLDNGKVQISGRKM